MKYIVVKTITQVTTEVYEIEVSNNLSPLDQESMAISLTTNRQPIGTDTVRTVDFKTMRVI